VFIGTNDFLNYIPSSKENDEKFVRLCLKALTRQINRLKAIGATHIVLFNMRDLKLSPLAHELADRYQNDYLVKLTDMVNLYNSLLKDHYKDSKQVRVFDINQFDASYFYTKLGSPCYVNNGNYIDPQNAPCLDRSNHFFYDRVHLTSSMNKELAKEVARFIVQ
jgi:phospholipase/lecithinase/hemolysin